MLNLTYQVLAKGLIRHHLCCYKLTGHDENCYDQKGSEHEQKHGSLHTTRSTNARRSRAKLRAQLPSEARQKKIGDVTLAPKVSRRQTLNASQGRRAPELGSSLPQYHLNIRSNKSR
jgi:hypothetical protein